MVTSRITQAIVGSVSALVLTFALVPFTGATSTSANVGGNNGTLKVHEQGTPANTESNDPKVCTFNFEGYGFDKGQDGVIVISSQLNGKDKTGVKQVSMPAANAAGYTETAYVTVPNGHYKTTLYGKDVQGNPDYNKDLKAKSKVIKVECAGSTQSDNGGQGGQTSSTSTTTGSVAGVSTNGTNATLPATIPSTGLAWTSTLGALVAAGASYGAVLRFRK